MTVLCLFLIGFSMLITAMNTPFFDDKLMEVILRIICFLFGILRKPSSKDDSTETNSLCPTLPTKVSVTGGKPKNSRTAKLSFPDSEKKVVHKLAIHFFVGFSSYFLQIQRRKSFTKLVIWIRLETNTVGRWKVACTGQRERRRALKKHIV